MAPPTGSFHVNGSFKTITPAITATIGETKLTVAATELPTRATMR